MCCGVFAAVLLTTWWTEVWVERVVFCAERLFGVLWGWGSQLCCVCHVCCISAAVSPESRVVCCLVKYARAAMCCVFADCTKAACSARKALWVCILLLLCPECWAQLGPAPTRLLTTTTGRHEQAPALATPRCGCIPRTVAFSLQGEGGGAFACTGCWSHWQQWVCSRGKSTWVAVRMRVVLQRVAASTLRMVRLVGLRTGRAHGVALVGAAVCGGVADAPIAKVGPACSRHTHKDSNKATHPTAHTHTHDQYMQAEGFRQSQTRVQEQHQERRVDASV